jgi:hypothetical protein
MRFPGALRLVCYRRNLQRENFAGLIIAVEIAAAVARARIASTGSVASRENG